MEARIHLSKRAWNKLAVEVFVNSVAWVLKKSRVVVTPVRYRSVFRALFYDYPMMNFLSLCACPVQTMSCILPRKRRLPAGTSYILFFIAFEHQMCSVCICRRLFALFCLRSIFGAYQSFDNNNEKFAFELLCRSFMLSGLALREWTQPCSADFRCMWKSFSPRCYENWRKLLPLLGFGVRTTPHIFQQNRG